MSDRIAKVAARLRSLREGGDAVSQAAKETLPYKRRVHDALGALRALVTDDTPTAQLDSDLHVVEGLVAAIVPFEKATRLIEELPAIRSSVAMDVEAAYEKDPSATSYGQIIMAFPSILAVATHRIAHVFYQLDEKVVARVMAEDAHRATGIDINPGARIGRYFFVDHGTGVVIGETCIIGDRVKLYHGVTLAAFSNAKGRGDAGVQRHPTLEDDVTIYPNATILGGETVIGEGSVIGGNVWLTESVPPYTRVTVESPKLEMHRKRPPQLGEGI
ncbi:MAG: serine acetyltransferase [Myxococcota bacterium]|nr:serine acetyltransferase [Myxococcota bacterium]